MKRSLPLAALVVCAAIIAAWLLWRQNAPPPSASPRPPSASPSPKVAVQKNSPPAPSPAMTPPSPAPPLPAIPPTIPQPPPRSDSPARIEADAIALNLRHYGQRFGGNPVGTNAEIVKTLNGGNPQGVRYLPQDHLRLNDQGELIDTWGTPYFFHQLSARQMEIRSAGPDKTLWTTDDIIAQ